MPKNVIDNDETNYAQIAVTTGEANVGSLSVKDQLTDYTILCWFQN
jgi:hypothetical protein